MTVARKLLSSGPFSRTMLPLLNWPRRRFARFVTRHFNRIYYRGVDGLRLYDTIEWLGVPILKCPLDLWMYQEILYRTKPDIIVETGVHKGGSSLYLASMCDILGHGRILACDISMALVDAKVRSHPRITLLEGSSTDPLIKKQITKACAGLRTMVILDSDHTLPHVREELRLYSPLVTPGCYLICEDTNVNGHPVYPTFGPGPYEAVEEFLQSNEGWMVDSNCERLLLTFNPRGYLLRQPIGLTTQNAAKIV